MTTRKNNATAKNKTSEVKKKTSRNRPITTAFCTGNSGEGRGTRGEGKRKSQSAKHKDQSASMDAGNATIESQIAFLESQIEMLKEESQVQSAERKAQSEERKEDENHSALCSLRSVIPRAVLATPVITAITSVGSHFMRVSWTPVANADSYLIQSSTGSAFTSNVQSHSVDSSVTSILLSELGANTLYYVRVRAIASGTNTNSEYSPTKSARTAIATNDENATHLQNWLVELQTVTSDFTTLLPQLETTELNSAARMRLNGSGVRRYGFIEKTADISGEFPQFWRASGQGTKELATMVREIEVLRNLLVWFRWAARVVQDLLLMTGDDAFRLAGSYYTVARDEARRRNPEAQQVFEMLQLFWRRRHRTTEEPTERELERDFRALLRGTKDGEIVVRNESDHVVKGEKVIIDNTMPKPRGGVKVVERGEVAE